MGTFFRGQIRFGDRPAGTAHAVAACRRRARRGAISMAVIAGPTDGELLAAAGADEQQQRAHGSPTAPVMLDKRDGP